MRFNSLYFWINMEIVFFVRVVCSLGALFSHFPKALFYVFFSCGTKKTQKNHSQFSIPIFFVVPNIIFFGWKIFKASVLAFHLESSDRHNGRNITEWVFFSLYIMSRIYFSCIRASIHVRCAIGFDGMCWLLVILNDFLLFLLVSSCFFIFYLMKEKAIQFW